MIVLNINESTAQTIRAEIASRSESSSALAKRLHLTVRTVQKCKIRYTLQDRPHTANRLQTTRSTAQELIVLRLRRTLLLRRCKEQPIEERSQRIALADMSKHAIHLREQGRAIRGSMQIHCVQKSKSGTFQECKNFKNRLILPRLISHHRDFNNDNVYST